MRIALCFRRDDTVHRLIWLTESKSGIYLGIQGAKEDLHISYHQDGTRHTKVGSQYHNRFHDEPIVLQKGVRQLHHLNFPLTQKWFTTETAYSGDDKTESLFLLDEELFRERGAFALDVWLLDRGSELKLFGIIGKLIKLDPSYQIITEIVTSLTSFPRHKIALTLGSTHLGTP